MQFENRATDPNSITTLPQVSSAVCQKHMSAQPPLRASPVTQDIQNIKDKKAMLNSKWILLPILLYVYFLSVKIAVMVWLAVKVESESVILLLKDFGLAHLSCFLLTLMLPIIICFMNIMKPFLYPMFILSIISPGIVSIAFYILIQTKFFLILSCIILVTCMVLIILSCRGIKLNILLIKVSLRNLNSQKWAIWVRLFPIFFFALLFNYYSWNNIDGIATAAILASEPEKGTEGTTPQVPTILWILSLISLLLNVYNIELLAAICYIFGAAYYNERTLQIENKDDLKERISRRELTGKENTFTLKKSFGTACLGACFVSLIGLINSFIPAGSSEDERLEDISRKGKLANFWYTFRSINVQAYVYCAMYGKELLESGKMARDSFKFSEVAQFASYMMVDRILNFSAFMGCFFIGSLQGLHSCWILPKMSDEQAGIAITNIFFNTLRTTISLFTLFYGVNSIIGGASATQLAIYVEDPERAKKTHPKQAKFEKYIKGREN